MSVRIGFAEFDATAGYSVNIGFAEFDTQANAGLRIGWVEFDTLAAGQTYLGWVEFDTMSPNSNPVPPFRPGGGISRYHSYSDKQYNIPVDDEGDEEEIILTILLEIAGHELF